MFLTRMIEGVANLMFGKPKVNPPPIYNENTSQLVIREDGGAELLDAVPADDEVILDYQPDDDSPTIEAAPLRNTHDELDRSVDTDKPVRIVDMEDTKETPTETYERAERLTKWILAQDPADRGNSLRELQQNDRVIYSLVMKNLRDYTEKAQEDEPFHPTLSQANTFEAQVKNDRPMTQAERDHTIIRGGYAQPPRDRSLEHSSALGSCGACEAEKAETKAKPRNIYEEAGMTSPPKLGYKNVPTQERVDRVHQATQAAHRVGCSGESLGHALSGDALAELRRVLPVVHLEDRE